jgi:hypothetical protein
MPRKNREQGFSGIPFARGIPDELSIGPVGDALPGAVVPQVTARRRDDRISSFELIFSPASAVRRGPGLLRVVRGIRTHRPVVPVRAYLRIGVEVIEQHEFSGQSVVVRGDSLAEETK